MPRIKLILNPRSDRGRTAAIGETLQFLLKERAESEAQKGIHYELDWALTERPSHATEIARQAAEEGYDMVVALGGDGTVHEVVNGLMAVAPAKRPRLGVVPAGSGNDFAHNIGLPHDPKESVHCLFGDASKPVDIISIQDGSGRQEFWDNTIGLGFSGTVSIESRKITRIYGFLMYLIAVLKTILFKPPALDVELSFDGRAAEKRGISMMSICNGPREGGGFPVNPNAIMDDGLMHYTIMRKMGRLPMLYFVPIVMSAKHLGYKGWFTEGTAQKIILKSDKAMSIHADGEIFAYPEQDVRQIEMNIYRHAVQVAFNC
jgi:YegS/Rv2252/BmrU family lipid kinase